MAAIDSECIHSGCVATALRRTIMSQMARIDDLENQLRKGRKMANIEDILDQIDPENLALWCEITDHSFSAKDPDKVIMNYRGEKRLSCGPCAGGIFSIPEPPSKNGPTGPAKTLASTVGT